MSKVTYMPISECQTALTRMGRRVTRRYTRIKYICLGFYVQYFAANDVTEILVWFYVSVKIIIIVQVCAFKLFIITVWCLRWLIGPLGRVLLLFSYNCCKNTLCTCHYNKIFTYLPTYLLTYLPTLAACTVLWISIPYGD